MALRYTARQLSNLKGNFYLANDTHTLCSHVGILRPTRYIHHSSRRSFSLSSVTSTDIYPAFLRKSQMLLCRPRGVHFNNLSFLKREVASSAPCLLNSALFNARSVNNKTMILSDIITDSKLDLVCLTETWHKESDGFLFNELTPAGYGLFDLPRSSGRGGGIIVLYNNQINISPVAVPQFNSFECLV